MRLANLSEFRRLFYTPDSAPSISTLRRRIRKIAGGTVQDGHYYVDLDEYDRVHHLRATVVERQRQLAQDPRLAGLIGAG